MRCCAVRRVVARRHGDEPAPVRLALLERDRAAVEVEDVAPEPAAFHQHPSPRALPLVVEEADAEAALVRPRGDGLRVARNSRRGRRRLAEAAHREAVAERLLHRRRGATNALARRGRERREVVVERRRELDLPAQVGPRDPLSRSGSLARACAASRRRDSRAQLAEEHDVRLAELEAAKSSSRTASATPGRRRPAGRLAHDRERAYDRRVHRRVTELAGQSASRTGRATSDRVGAALTIDRQHVRSEDLGLAVERPQEVVRVGLDLVTHHPRPDTPERLELLDGASHTNEDAAPRDARRRPCGPTPRRRGPDEPPGAAWLPPSLNSGVVMWLAPTARAASPRAV